jgi:signal transduction histidine kinase
MTFVMDQWGFAQTKLGIMKRLTPHENDPFQLLVYLERFLLITVVLIELFMPTPFFKLNRLPWVGIASITGFGLMGLKLPQRQAQKIWYTLLEMALLLLGTFVGGMRLFAFLYIVLVIRSCLIFAPVGQAIVALTSFLFSLLTLVYYIHYTKLPIELPEQVTSRLVVLFVCFVFLFGLSLMFILLLMNAILSERKSLEKLAIANQQLHRYALRIEDQATLQERNRIAREIHDSLGHSLTGLNIQLETALKLIAIDPQKAQTFLASAKRLGTSALGDVRASVSLLRSTPLQGDALKPSLDELIQNFHRTAGILPNCNLEISPSLSTEQNTALYRIIQESLTNICKYSDAKTVHIDLRCKPSVYVLSVRDDDKGFDINQNTTGFGIQGMRERTLALEGTFHVSSQLGAGCCITASFPSTGASL